MINSTKLFLKHVKKECKKSGIELNLPNEKWIWCDGLSTSGYFCDETKEIVVATGKSEEEWVGTLAHEFCHLQQWENNIKVWRQMKVGDVADAGSLLDLWIRRYIELTPQQSKTYGSLVRDLELDCEKRTVRLIRKFGLPIETKGYTMAANAYVMFYNAVVKLRKWSKPGKPVYDIPDIIRRMNCRFDMNYSTISPKLLNVYDKVMFIPSQTF